MHVALVEPSRIIRKALGEMLLERGDSVTEFDDGAKALSHLLKTPNVDVVITSLELAFTTGLELCWEAQLLTQSRRPVYSIAMSSSQDDSRLIESLDSGADDFMCKPPKIAELHARLRAAERTLAMQKELIRLADHDPLTGIYNRRAFFANATACCLEAVDAGPLSAALFDIDHFKKVNDKFGHAVGDEAIRMLAETACLDGTVVGRIGGEEFAMMLPGLSLDAAWQKLEKLRKTIDGTRIETEADPLHITCSFGVSQWHPGESVDKVLRRADEALYLAKDSGRNKVIAAQETLDGAIEIDDRHARIRTRT